MPRLFLYFSLILLIGSSTSHAQPRPTEPLQNGELTLMPASPENGFHFDYFLYIPEELGDREVHLLVEPNNSGKTDDDHAFHLKRARQMAELGIPRFLADTLNVPLLIPVFDRPASDPGLYTHALDRDALKRTEGVFARVDLQLLAMVDQARHMLEEKGYRPKNRIFMHGYSASGTYVNRFSLLHPERVKAVAAGGLNGKPILPDARLGNQLLRFPVGVGDVQDLTGKTVDLDTFRQVPQYLYMGELDTNDTLPYGDAYDPEEKAQTLNVMGTNMSEQWEFAKQRYSHHDIPAQMVTYAGTGHAIPKFIFDDLCRFFEAHQEEGWHPIEPTDAVSRMQKTEEIPNLEKGTIYRVLSGNHEEIPEWMNTEPGQFLILIEEWIPERDYKQMGHLLTKIPPAQRQVVLTDASGNSFRCPINGMTFSQGDGRFQGFYSQIPEEANETLLRESPMVTLPEELDASILDIAEGVKVE